MKRDTQSRRPRFTTERWLVLVAIGIGLAITLYWTRHEDRPAPPAQTVRSESTPISPERPERVPPFHPTVEAARPLPRTLPANWFRNPLVAQAYAIAERIPEVLAQQPCYCWCDQFGHGSLLDCYASDHGAT
ncbi:MAG: hypothetical protein D6723_03705 [Acidobacteria bacterium]|nr:MAG: hypothetical protein D6723_03705 [Acidobacteriota bacterium]